MLLILSLVWGALAGAPAGGPILAVSVQGSVQVTTAGASAWALAPFSRVAAGDKLQVPEGASIQLLYPGSGRRETWTGPATVGIRADHGEGQGTPVVADVGAGARQQLDTVAVLLTRAEQERGGTTLIRGDGARSPLDFVAQAEVDAAYAAYDAAAAARADARDIAPEMLLAAALLTHDQLEPACEALKRAEAACTGCAAPATLLDWIGREACK